MLALLKSGLTEFSVEEISLFENYLFVWNVSGSAFKNEFVQNPKGYSDRFSDYDREVLVKVENLRESVIEPLLLFKENAKDKNGRLEAIARQIPDIREYISVKEAVAMFGVERNTLYRLIKSGRIPAVNIGTRIIRIKRSDMENRFLTRPESIAEKERPNPKLYSMEPEDCYTITQVCEKYHINDSSVWAHVRKYSIPSRQIGNYVYVPKQEIDNLYKSEIE